VGVQLLSLPLTNTDTIDFAKKETVLVRPNKINYGIPDRGINLFGASLIMIFQAL
jgi:hypothetical protein